MSIFFFKPYELFFTSAIALALSLNYLANLRTLKNSRLLFFIWFKEALLFLLVGLTGGYVTYFIFTGQPGLSVAGALVASFLSAQGLHYVQSSNWTYTWRRHGPGLPFALALGRVGCAYAHCCPGSIYLPYPLVASSQIEISIVLLESSLLCLLGILIWPRYKKQLNSAQPLNKFYYFIAGYAFIRLFTDIFRTDRNIFLAWGDLSYTQGLAIVIISFLINEAFWHFKKIRIH